MAIPEYSPPKRANLPYFCPTSSDLEVANRFTYLRKSIGSLILMIKSSFKK
jgi:hypothetical protein